MPASLPGDTTANNLANPNAGKFVTFDPLSGPKGSPLDARKITAWGTVKTGTPVYANDPTQVSTGALSTGIGIGPSVIGLTPDLPVLTPSAYAILRAGFNDNMVAGNRLTYAAPPPPGTVATNVEDSTRMYIGGGRMVANAGVTPADYGRPFIPSPYTAGIAIFGAGNGGSRDAGAGPAFTGFGVKMVTAAGAVATGAVVETGFANRSGVALVTGQSMFGSGTAASATPA